MALHVVSCTLCSGFLCSVAASAEQHVGGGLLRGGGTVEPGANTTGRSWSTAAGSRGHSMGHIPALQAEGQVRHGVGTGC